MKLLDDIAGGFVSCGAVCTGLLLVNATPSWGFVAFAFGVGVVLKITHAVAS